MFKWYNDFITQAKKSAIAYCPTGQGVKKVIKDYVVDYCQKCADPTAAAEDRYGYIHIDSFTGVEEFVYSLAAVTPKQRHCVLGPPNFHKIVVIDEISSAMVKESAPFPQLYE